MSIRCFNFLAAVLAFCIGPSSQVWAEPEFIFSGFGTLGYVISDSSDSEYRTWQGQDGADDSGSFKVDSRLGIQLDVGLTETVSATIQALSRQNLDGEFVPDIEWAFLKSELNDSISLRIGRIGVPFYMVSDFREVGYANTLLRPPEDTYIQAPLGSFDGLDINGNFDWGETLVSAQAIAGVRKSDFFDDTKISLRDGIGAVVAFERSIARLRFSYIRARINARSDELDSFGAQLAQGASLIPQLAEVAQDFNGRRKISTFAGVGLDIDMAPWFAAAEYTQRRLDDAFVSSFDAWYISAGYRWKSLTPYAFVSSLRQTSKTEVNLPPLPQLDELSEALAANYAAGDQNTIAVGLRWDFYDNAALKAQLENISRVSRGASFTRGDELPIENPDDVKLFSLALDFTF